MEVPRRSDGQPLLPDDSWRDLSPAAEAVIGALA
jgi:hypothetical protein